MALRGKAGSRKWMKGCRKLGLSSKECRKMARFAAGQRYSVGRKVRACKRTDPGVRQLVAEYNHAWSDNGGDPQGVKRVLVKICGAKFARKAMR